jgi:hypothetical protein
LPDGKWLRWGNVKDETKYTGKAVNVECSNSGRKLEVVVTGANGAEKKSVRDPDGTWSK